VFRSIQIFYRLLSSKVFLVLFLLLICGCSFAQDQRPKIGLVLSGGGAKGIAHIGVLKAMEEAGLTPDYITGTSMGSIVGGLYAAGYSADELKEIVEGIDWGLLLSNKIPFDEVTYEEKPFYGRYLIDFYMKGRELQLPKGIIEGQALMQLFSNLTRPVHDIDDFNNLPIPFACVGADIATGKKVVLNKGSLAMSMRASMAIPSIFTPVRIDDHLLVDGGLVHNMPVTEVLEMGADIVIGVFVSSDLDPEENLTSALSILTQSAFITSAFDARQELAKCNILVQPRLDDFSTGSFGSAPELLQRGSEAGKDYLEVFKKLADSIKQFGPLHKVVKPAIEKEYVFVDVQVEGTTTIDKEYILGKIQIKPGESVSIDHIKKRLQLIYGTLYFEKVWYEIHGPSDHLVLKILVVERPQAQFRFSFHYDGENKGGIVANATFRNLLLNRSRLIFEADLASFPRITLDYFKYLGKSQNIAIQATGIYSRNELPAYDSAGNLNYLFSSTYASGGLKLQTTRFQNGAFGIEARINAMSLKPKIAESTIRSISRIEYTNTSLDFFYRFDNTNDRYFPTKGLKTEFKISTTAGANGTVEIGDTVTLGSDLLGEAFQTTNIWAIDINLFPHIPLSSRLTLLLKGRLRLSNLRANTLNLMDYDFIGGFTPNLINSNEYYGVGTKEFSMANYFYGRVGLQYKIRKNIFLQGHFNYLNSERPVTWFYPDADVGKFGDRTMRYGYGALVGIRSPIGPVALAVAKDHFREDWKASLIIGYYY
jgi:NTE family protein